MMIMMMILVFWLKSHANLFVFRLDIFGPNLGPFIFLAGKKNILSNKKGLAASARPPKADQIKMMPDHDDNNKESNESMNLY